VVLTGITGVYVYLTYRLLQVQERPTASIRLAAQDAVARAVSAKVKAKRHLLGVIHAKFPLDRTKKPSTSDFSNQDLDALQVELMSVAPQLMEPLAYLCHTAALAVTDAILSLTALQMTISVEEKNSAAAGRAWSWDEARRTYLTEVREQVSTKPEWGDVLEGKAVAEAVRALKEFDDKTTQYLRGS